MWDVMTISGQRVGYQVTRIRHVMHDGQPLREAGVRSEMTLQRFGQTTRQQMEIVQPGNTTTVGCCSSAAR